jgi:hypothetical protein
MVQLPVNCGKEFGNYGPQISARIFFGCLSEIGVGLLTDCQQEDCLTRSIVQLPLNRGKEFGNHGPQISARIFFGWLSETGIGLLKISNKRIASIEALSSL